MLGRAIRDRFPRYYRFFATHAFHLQRPRDAQSQQAAGQRRRHRRHQDRLHQCVGLQSGQLDAAQRAAHRCGGARRPQRRESATPICAGWLANISRLRRPSGRRRLWPRRPSRRAQRQNSRSLRCRRRLRPPIRARRQPWRRPHRAAAAPVPPPGSTDPIRPVTVKTISVKSAAAIGQFLRFRADESAQAAPVAQPASAEPAPSSGARSRAPAPAGSRAGRLGRRKVRRTRSCRSRQSQYFDTADAQSSSAQQRLVRSGRRVRGRKGGQAAPQFRANSSQDFARCADAFTEKVVKGDKALFRARFAGLDKEKAEAACRYLKRNEIACVALKN